MCQMFLRLQFNYFSVYSEFKRINFNDVDGTHWCSYSKTNAKMKKKKKQQQKNNRVYYLN